VLLPRAARQIARQQRLRLPAWLALPVALPQAACWHARHCKRHRPVPGGRRFPPVPEHWSFGLVLCTAGGAVALWLTFAGMAEAR
jgi:hypothetical protein